MTEKISTDKKDRIVKEAYGKLSEAGARGVSLSASSANVKYWLEGVPEVKKVSVRGRNTITVEFEDSSRVGILLDSMNRYGGSLVRNPASSVRVVSRARITDSASHALDEAPETPRSTRALLLDPLYDDWPPESTTDSIERALLNAGYTVDKMLGDQADLAHIETIESSEYGAIFMRTHGGVLDVDGNDKTHIMVRPFFDTYPDVADSGYEGIDVFYVNTDWGAKYAYAFNEDFVRHHLAAIRFPNTLMHLLVCHGGDPVGVDDLITAFLSFGVACYTGWTRNASLGHGDPAAVEFFEHLCESPGRTVAETIDRIEYLGHSPDPGTAADLVAYGTDNFALRSRPALALRIDEKEADLMQGHPGQLIDIVMEIPHGTQEAGVACVYGTLSAIDRFGKRYFIPKV